jgi:hypothetical protein
MLQNGRLIGENKLVSMWQEAAMAYLKLLSLHLPRRTAEKYGNLQDRLCFGWGLNWMYTTQMSKVS